MNSWMICEGDEEKSKGDKSSFDELDNYWASSFHDFKSFQILFFPCRTMLK